MPLNHIKPHGALYGMAARLEPIAQAVADVADIFRVPLYGMVNCLHEEVYKARGHQFVGEYYADLEYADDGGLLITREHEAVDPERAAQRSLTAIKEGTTTSVGGKTVRVGSDTICVHSDTPNAVAVAARVRETVKPYLAAA
ncbi:MAG: LamB/YcsF family protein, partial [Tistlia sp.]